MYQCFQDVLFRTLFLGLVFIGAFALAMGFRMWYKLHHIRRVGYEALFHKDDE